MGFLDSWYTREPKQVIEKETPPNQGIVLFFEVLWREFWGLCELNLIFVVFCVPLITIPAAITAMNKIMIFMLMDNPVDIFADFFATFKAEWKRATIAGLMYFPLLALTIFGQYFYLTVMPNPLLYLVSMLSCAVVIIAGFYLFAMIAVLDLSLQGALRNSLLLVFIRVPQNVVTLLVVVLLALLVWMFFPATLLILIVIFFAFVGFVCTFCAYTGLKDLVIKKELP